MGSIFSKHEIPSIPTCNNLDEDLLMEIFKRLPAKTLCRFQCVSKPWKALISSSFFINLHHSFTLSGTPPRTLKPYLRVDVVDDGPYTYESYTVRRHNDDVSLYFPFRSITGGRLFKFVDVICGVVCFSYSVNSAFDSTVLWNPATHNYLSLPRLPFPSQLDEFADDFADVIGFDCNVIGFGYDAPNNDFKVVRVWVPSNTFVLTSSSLSPAYEVYSSKLRQWRSETCDHIKNVNFSLFNKSRRTSCFVNGKLHWLLKDDDVYTLMKFDCETEELTAIILDREIYINDVGERFRVTEVMVYEGVLSAAVSTCSVDHRLEVWAIEVMSSSATCLRRHKLLYVFDVKNIYSLEYFHCISRKLVELIDRGHVYEESMFLLNDKEAKSYSKEGIVQFSSAALDLGYDVDRSYEWCDCGL